ARVDAVRRRDVNGVAAARHGGGVEAVAGDEVELAAVAAPLRGTAAVARDADAVGVVIERRHVDLLAAGVVGDVRHPALIGRDPRGRFARRRLQPRFAAAIARGDVDAGAAG